MEAGISFDLNTLKYMEIMLTFPEVALWQLKQTGNRVHKNVWTWFIYNILKPTLTLLSLFVRHKGFMDGWYGLLFAYYSALHFPKAYKKYILADL